MRADARRNRSAVLDAGARLLAERPTASMQEIADASGVGRTTVYRHFPAREDLVSALLDQVVAEVVEVAETVFEMKGPASDALRRLAMDTTSLGHRWRFLSSQRTEFLARLEQVDRDFLAWFEAKQRMGELRDDLPSAWIQDATRAILTAAGDEAEAIGAEEAGRLAGETLVSAFATR